MINQHHLDNETHRALVSALANVKRDHHTGMFEAFYLIEALGEIGGIWPESVLDDPMICDTARSADWTASV